MDDKRQKNQLVLAFMEEDRGEAPKSRWRLSSPPQAYSRTILFDDGARRTFRRVERPSLLIESGRPRILFLAVGEGSPDGSLARTWIQAIPLEPDSNTP